MLDKRQKLLGNKNVEKIGNLFACATREQGQDIIDSGKIRSNGGQVQQKFIVFVLTLLDEQLHEDYEQLLHGVGQTNSCANQCNEHDFLANVRYGPEYVPPAFAL